MKILVSVPHQGWIHEKVVTVLEALKEDSRHQISIIRPRLSPYENSLHHIVRKFRATDCDFWLNIDSDNPPRNNPLDLVDLDLDVIGLPTPVWYYVGKAGESPMYYTGYDFVPEEDAYRPRMPGDGLQEVDAIGSGCMLIARRVFQNTVMRFAPFARKTHADGRVRRGTDLAFSERARQNGFRLWVHYDYPCDHFKEINLCDVAMGYNDMKTSVSHGSH